MYYEESFHDGLWWFRGSPKGEWVEFPNRMYKDKCIELSKPKHEYSHTYSTINGTALKCRILEERQKKYVVVVNENGVNVYLHKKHLKRIKNPTR